MMSLSNMLERAQLLIAWLMVAVGVMLVGVALDRIEDRVMREAEEPEPTPPGELIVGSSDRPMWEQNGDRLYPVGGLVFGSGDSAVLSSRLGFSATAKLINFDVYRAPRLTGTYELYNEGLGVIRVDADKRRITINEESKRAGWRCR